MKLTIIIPAAGQSTRFDSNKNRNKLDEDLGGRPLLLRTVELFTKLAEVIEILVAAPPDDLEQFKFKYADRLAFHGARIVPGGKSSRAETIQKALTEVSPEATHVAVHDAARPATNESLIKRVIEAGTRLAAVIPVVPIHATVKRLRTETIETAAVDPIAGRLLGEAGTPKNEARPVSETIERAGLVEVQTPQLFAVDLLKRAYAQENPHGATDDAQLVERLDETVYAVEGDRFNLKITTTADLNLVRKILDLRPPKDRPVHRRF